MARFKFPRAYKKRLKAVNAEHGKGSWEDFGIHLLEGGLKAYGQGDTAVPLPDRLEAAVDDQGYASVDELVEHLLERGLTAYEAPAESREKLEERLRGLGYLE